MSEIKHGTRAGYRAHRRAGEAPCPACRTANALYAKEQRAKKAKAAAPAAETALAPVVPDEAIKYLSLAEEGVSRWSTSLGWVEPQTGSLTVVDDGSLGLPVGERLIELIVEVVEEHRPAVLLISKTDVIALGRFDQSFTKKLPCKVAVVEAPASWVPDPDGSLARHLAASNTRMITLADRVRRDRQELEREQVEGPAPHRIQGAVVNRGRMFRELGRFEKPKELYEPLPQDSPARRHESWLGSGLPPKPKRRLPWSGRR
jgi:hypothetical protein